MILPSYAGGQLEGYAVPLEAVRTGPTQAWEVPLQEFHSSSLGYQIAPGSPASKAHAEPGHVGTARGYVEGIRGLEWVGGLPTRSHSKGVTELEGWVMGRD